MSQASVTLVLQTYSSLGLCLLEASQPVLHRKNDSDPYQPTPRSKGEKARNKRHRRG